MVVKELKLLSEKKETKKDSEIIIGLTDINKQQYKILKKSWENKKKNLIKYNINYKI